MKLLGERLEANNMRKIGFYIGIIFAVIISIYCYLYYPQQQMPIGQQVYVETPEYEKYRNDCLHPCIRYDENSDTYFMAQTPYYGWNNKLENPIFYTSSDYMHWSDGILLAETPATGYNSDPCILVTCDTILYIWRECSTPLCDSLDCVRATVGGIMENGKLLETTVLAVNQAYDYDTEQCPILMNIDNDIVMYAAWYQYAPERINKGIARWKMISKDDMKFELTDTIAFSSTYTADKCAQVRFLNRIWFLPKPQKHDLWHFDLFEYDNKLYMVSVAEKGDNIMLSVSDDYLHFKTYRKPLVNNHYSENYTGYRQYYYKPTAFVKNDSLYLFYTANAKDDPNKNQLFVTIEDIHQIID